MADAPDHAVAPAQPGPGPLRILMWAAFLACSWTWCIGMFLPVLLTRDFGAWAFAVFAAPNVIGAAAMGIALRNPDRSRAFVERHALACRAFSVVTIAFQCYFGAWLIAGVADAALRTTLLLVFLGVMLFAGSGSEKGRWSPLFASALWLASAALLAAYALRHGMPALPARGELPGGPIGMWPLALVCILGFGACPWLDLTFHSARQALPGRSGGAAFALGFGVFFLAMIFGTLLYAPAVLSQSAGAQHPAAVGSFAAIHIVAQLAFTCSVHLGRAKQRLSDRVPRLGWLGLTGLVSPLAIVAVTLAAALPSYAGLDMHEVVYRGFMVFYGLVFPAYVLCVACGPRAGRAGWMLAAAAVLTAVPCYWMGFIERQTIWMAAGTGIVVACAASSMILRIVRAGSPPAQ